MSPVMVKLLASAALPASVLPSVVSETRPCRAFRLVTLSIASPGAASAAAAINAVAKTAPTNRFKANACLELIPILPLPSGHYKKLRLSCQVWPSVRRSHREDGGRLQGGWGHVEYCY